jgi:MoxR-like ATPase
LKPSDLSTYLNSLVRNRIKTSLMIWGPPGIGKSSIVQQTAEAHDVGFIDLRLSQLAPTDLRGLPVAKATSKTSGLSRWYPPEFLPRRGHGILFLDEINLAPPTMQGMAQQLILDRRVGSYEVPPGWFIWAAGNRSEDRAAVFDMPAPLANRFLHLDVGADLDSFKSFALARGVHEHVIAFLLFRPTLLHKLDPQQPAWPSPRSWVMASQLHQVSMDVAPAVGAATATEFNAYVALYHELPNLERVLRGEGDTVQFPAEPSMRYATVIGLTTRAKEAQHGYHAFKWLTNVAATEWVQLCASDLFKAMRVNNQWPKLRKLILQDVQLKAWMVEYQELLKLD